MNALPIAAAFPAAVPLVPPSAVMALPAAGVGQQQSFVDLIQLLLGADLSQPVDAAADESGHAEAQDSSGETTATATATLIPGTFLPGPSTPVIARGNQDFAGFASLTLPSRPQPEPEATGQTKPEYIAEAIIRDMLRSSAAAPSAAAAVPQPDIKLVPMASSRRGSSSESKTVTPEERGSSTGKPESLPTTSNSGTELVPAIPLPRMSVSPELSLPTSSDPAPDPKSTDHPEDQAPAPAGPVPQVELQPEAPQVNTSTPPNPPARAALPLDRATPLAAPMTLPAPVASSPRTAGAASTRRMAAPAANDQGRAIRPDVPLVRPVSTRREASGSGDVAFELRLTPEMLAAPERLAASQPQRALPARLSLPESEARRSSPFTTDAEPQSKPSPTSPAPKPPVPSEQAPERQAHPAANPEPRDPQSKSAKPAASQDAEHAQSGKHRAEPVRSEGRVAEGRVIEAKPQFRTSPIPLTTPQGIAQEKSAPASAAPPPDVAAALRTAEPSRPADLATKAPSTRANTPAQEIAVRLTSPDAAPVDVQLSGRGAQVRVEVRTADAGLQSTLRQEIGTLVNTLEQTGFRTEAHIPTDGSRAAQPSWQPVATAHSGGSGWGDTADQPGQRHGRQHEQQQQQQQQPQQQARQKRPAKNTESMLEEISR